MRKRNKLKERERHHHQHSKPGPGFRQFEQRRRKLDPPPRRLRRAQGTSLALARRPSVASRSAKGAPDAELWSFGLKARQAVITVLQKNGDEQCPGRSVLTASTRPFHEATRVPALREGRLQYGRPGRLKKRHSLMKGRAFGARVAPWIRGKAHVGWQFSPARQHRHCEARSAVAIHLSNIGTVDCFAPLAMTVPAGGQLGACALSAGSG